MTIVVDHSVRNDSNLEIAELVQRFQSSNHIGILAEPHPEEHRASDASRTMAADDGRARPPSFETPSFAALCWAPPAITAKPLRGDEVRDLEPMGFMESIH
jgi:hypothetical protein